MQGEEWGRNEESFRSTCGQNEISPSRLGGVGYRVDEAEPPSPVCIGSQDGMEEQDPHRDHMDLSTTGSWE